MRALGALLSVLAGIIVCAGLIGWIASTVWLVALYSPSIPYPVANYGGAVLMAVSLPGGAVGGAWLGARVFARLGPSADIAKPS